jgi:heme exporter protein B
MDYLRKMLAIVEKDIISELRTKELFTSMLVFVLLTMVIFNFAFGQDAQGDVLDLASGILWVAFLFAAILGLNRSFVHEKDEGCMDGLLLSPVDRSAIYVAKVIGNLIFISIVELITIPVFVLFFIKDATKINFALFVLIIILANLGIASIGTLLSAISINTRARDLMMPILFFPVIVPVLIAAVKSTATILGVSGTPSDIYAWLQLLLVYDMIFLLVSYMTFEYILEE